MNVLRGAFNIVTDQAQNKRYIYTSSYTPARCSVRRCDSTSSVHTYLRSSFCIRSRT